MIGTSFGPYSILGPLGAGGMGEVYRARDPRLGREVAIKIIGGGSVGDPERQARFEREARAASALNHPNILTVHDVGREGDTAYIVCELVEGESLRESMRHGPLPVKELLAFAAQIADGLAAAHEAGIVHRDLKPENVMVTRSGLVKILDFGLAKVVEGEGAAEARTVSELWSRTGMISGTAPYMSPEQAAGKSVDFRSDQFSFGVMLYEMAAGRRPFDRETGAQTLSAIIAEEPEPLAVANPKIPAPLRWVIERCLAKKPGDRYAATADLHRDLRTLRDRLPEATTAGTNVAIAPARPLRRRLARTAAALVLIALAALGGLLLSRREPQNPYDIASFRFTPFATDSAVESVPEWSPDGKSLAYSREIRGASQIIVQGISSPVGTQVTDLPGNCTDPFWAPDGSRVYFISSQRSYGATSPPGPDGSALYSVGAAGGPPTLVLADVRQASISPDGRTLAFVRQKFRRQLWISSPPGAEPEKFFGSDEEVVGFAAVRFAPDGEKIALRGRTPNGEYEVWIVDFPEGKGKMRYQLGSDEPGPRIAWMPDSRRIVGGGESSGIGGHLWILDIVDGRRSSLTVGFGEAHAYPSVSPDGSKVAFAATASDFDLVEIPLDGSPVRTLLATSRLEGLPSWAPAGNQLAYATDREGPRGIWVYSPGEGTARPLVTARDFEGRVGVFDSPSFSPDGRRIAYQAASQSGDLWISSVAGGPPVPLAGGIKGDSPTWSPDGNWIAYVQATPASAFLRKAAVGASTGPAELTAASSAVWQHPQWSPNGEWIACITPDGLTLVSPDGKQKRLLLAGSGFNPYGWSRDGATIYGLQEDSRNHTLVAAIDVTSARLTALGDLGPKKTYFGFSLSPDGKSFATTLALDTSDIWILDGLTPSAR